MGDLFLAKIAMLSLECSSAVPKPVNIYSQQDGKGDDPSALKAFSKMHTKYLEVEMSILYP